VSREMGGCGEPTSPTTPRHRYTSQGLTAALIDAASGSAFSAAPEEELVPGMIKWRLPWITATGGCGPLRHWSIRRVGEPA
jgi:hypothetical protein